MDSGNTFRLSSGMVRALCVCVLSIILVAGLWPFYPPSNQVSWLAARNGLHFGRRGSAVSSGAFQSQDSNGGPSSTLEIWLKPALTRGTRTILSFDGSGDSVQPFALQQHGTALSVRRHNIDELGTDRIAVFEVENSFRENQPVLVTVTLEKHETSVYLDGVLAKTDPISGISINNFSGRLVVADSSRTSDGWPGEILGLATYNRQLTPAQVMRHYDSWTQSQPAAITAEDAPLALYRFDERAGNTVRNQFDPATNLEIPRRYSVLHSAIFLAPWREYRLTWEYAQDFAVNVVGFIPFGLCFAAYFSRVRMVRRPALTVIALGFLTSLTIETWQIFLPTRGSGATDLITNTAGTAIGVALYRWPFVQGLLGSSMTGKNRMGLSRQAERGAELVTLDSTTYS
jgi:VanZ family protein